MGSFSSCIKSSAELDFLLRGGSGLFIMQASISDGDVPVMDMDGDVGDTTKGCLPTGLARGVLGATTVVGGGSSGGLCLKEKCPNGPQNLST